MAAAAAAAAAKTTTAKGGLLFLFVPKTLSGHKIEMENYTFGQAFLDILRAVFPSLLVFNNVAAVTLLEIYDFP